MFAIHPLAVLCRYPEYKDAFCNCERTNPRVGGLTWHQVREAGTQRRIVLRFLNADRRLAPGTDTGRVLFSQGRNYAHACQKRAISEKRGRTLAGVDDGRCEQCRGLGERRSILVAQRGCDGCSGDARRPPSGRSGAKSRAGGPCLGICQHQLAETGMVGAGGHLTGRGASERGRGPKRPTRGESRRDDKRWSTHQSANGRSGGRTRSAGCPGGGGGLAGNLQPPPPRGVGNKGDGREQNTSEWLLRTQRRLQGGWHEQGRSAQRDGCRVRRE